MTTDPQAARYAPDTPITALQDRLADPVAPADFPKTILRFRNRRWDKAVGLDQITDAEWAPLCKANRARRSTIER